ncbi:ice-binding family protein [Rufibacter sp. XAAS-G3-1]|uniref:ice-binding family protein n=1 Tax=Rufibacter sp. XAAS-G3-1 TaxID=2729134 RepID=UPI0015E72BD4|nr:ice-binding family protein [Rufibacter sp. XAAS-G3-1]
MKIRLLLLLFFLLSQAGVFAQIAPAFKALQQVSVAGGAGYESKGNSKVKRQVLPFGIASKEVLNEIDRVAAELKRQQPTATLSGAALTGGKLLPGVYRVKGDVHLQKSLELLGSKFPNGIFVFQVEGSLRVAPSVNVELRQGARAKNVFWQVAGDVAVGAQSNFKGTIVASGNISAGKAATVEGKLLTKAGSVALSGTTVTELGSEHISDLEVKHVVSEGPYRVGLLVTYTITLQNWGPSEETNVVLNFETPSGIQFLGANTSMGSAFDPVRREWIIKKLPSGTTATMVVQASILKTEFSTTVVTVTGDGTDPNIKNNTSELSICATPSKPGEITGKTSVCVNTPGNVYQIERLPGTRKYSWSLPSGWVITSGQDSNEITVSTGGAEAQGTISVRAVNACGDGPESVLEVSTVSFAPPTPSAITGPLEVCIGQKEITYAIDPIASAISYAWEIPGDWTVVRGQGTSSVAVLPGATSGEIKVTAENACGKSASSNVQVTISPAAPPKPEPISGPAHVCAHTDNIVYQVAAVLNATSYTWTVPADWDIVSGQGTARVVVRAGATKGQVTVKAQNGCGTSPVTFLPVSISSEAPKVGSVSGDVAVCLSNAEHTYAVEEIENAGTYTWSVPSGWRILSGQGSRRINVKVGSSGEVKVIASNGCGDSAPVALHVSVSAGVPELPSAISGNSAPCNSGSEHVYSVATDANVTGYTWAVPQGWIIVSGQGSHTIKVKAGATPGSISVMGSNGCGNSPVRTLAVTPATTVPVAPASITGETVPCSDGQQTYSVPNAVAGLTYTWALPDGWNLISGQGGASIVVKAGTTAGQVTVTASNNCGQSAATHLEVTPAAGVPVLAATIQGEVAGCSSANQLTYSITSTNAAASFLWQVPEGWEIVSGQGMREITVKAGTGNGVIQVLARNGCGQSVTRSLAVTASPTLPATPGLISGSANLCATSGEVTYSVGQVNGAATYNWSVPTGWAILRGQGTTSLVVRVGPSAGQVQVTAGNACGTSAASVLAVKVSTSVPPAIGAITGESAFCASAAPRTYTVTEAEGINSYTWSAPAGWEILSGQGTGSISVRPGATGGYLKVVASNYCGTSADSTSISVSPPLSATPLIITGAKAACVNDEPITYSVEAVAGATQYTWKVPVGWQLVSGENTTAIQVKAGTGAGTISVAISDACGGSATANLAVSVASSAPFALGPITGQSATCTASRLTYQVPNDVYVNTYAWVVPAGWNIELGQGTHSITVVPGTSNGVISVRGVNGCGITSSVSSLQVQVQTVPPLRPNPMQVIAAALTPCAGEKGLVFEIQAVNGASEYEWTVPAGWLIEAGQGTTKLTVTAGSQNGQVSVVAKNGCGQSESRAVAVVPTTGVPVITGEITGSTLVCVNAGSVTYSINSPGATQYMWSVPAGWSLIAGQNTNTITVVPSAASGVVSVKAFNGCGASLEKSLTVVPSVGGALKPGVIDGPIAFCASGEQRVYTVTQTGSAATYEWSVPTGWKIISGQGTDRLVVSTQAGAGLVSVKTVNGCGNSAEANLSVTVAPGLGVAPVIKDESSACVGNQFSVPAMAGVSYKWSIISDTPGWAITSGQGADKVTVQAPENALPGSAKLMVEVNNGTCATTSAMLEMVPKFLAPQLHVPNVFSPNNDGKNDVWVVANLLEYPENEVVIMNRWGSEVYRMKKYRNNWNGGGLAEGTYYYVLRVRLCEGQEETKKGYVTIMR